MKSFILSIPDNLKKANNTLDAKAVLCGNSWEVFNDEGIKQIFIFNKDNSLLISTNGDVETFSWQYIPTNNSIIITTGNKTSLFRPAFHNDVIFALQKDGTEEYYFLINESNVSLFPSRKLDELESYFHELELKHLEKERRIIELEHKREEEARQNKLKAEQEAEELLVNKNNEKRIIREYIDANYSTISSMFMKRQIIGIIFICLILLFAILSIIYLFDLALALSLIFLFFVLCFFAVFTADFKSLSLSRMLEKDGKEIRFLDLDEILTVYKEYKASINKIA